jgi:hypothetical protein
LNVVRLAPLLVTAVTLYACGPALRPPPVSPQLLQQEIEYQREMTFRTDVERRIKLHRIYTPLRLANADLCGEKVSSVTGMVAIDRQSVAQDLRATAQRLYGVADGVTILDVVPGSPAEQIGLQPRDVITGAAKGTGVMPSGWTLSGLTVQDLAKIILNSDGGPLTILVRRSGNIFPLVLMPGRGCSYPIESIFDDRFNAFADGNRIVVFTGLFNHVPDDREVAVIIGHELAHNILRHVEKQQGNAAAAGAAGLVLDIGLLALGVNTQGAITRASMQAGARAYSQEFESEADYLGLYMLARAGFEIDIAPDLFRRRAVQNPSTQVRTYYSTHPSTPERAAAMTQTIGEINQKRSSQIALLPSTLPGQTLEVRAQPISSQPVVVAAPTPPPPTGSAQSPAVPVPVTAFAPIAPPPQSATVPLSAPAPAIRSSGSMTLAQLFLIRGPVVTNPPQTFSAEFSEDGKASAILSGRRLVTGNYELFGLSDSIKEKYSPRLINADSVKPRGSADAKGFAALSDNSGTDLECAYTFNRSTRRGEGTCADNQRNTYTLVFD